MKVQEALHTLKAYNAWRRDEGDTEPLKMPEPKVIGKAIDVAISALSDIEKCEPVAQAIRERDRLGFAVVNVIGKLDEIIENTQEVEIDDFLHIAIPIDKWHELQDVLEEMPKRAELYTSPQPIEKCEPELYMAKNLHNKSYATSHSEAEARLFLLQSSLKVDGIESEVISLCRCDTSPQPRDWVELSDDDIRDVFRKFGWTANRVDFEDARAIEAKLKELNT